MFCASRLIGALRADLLVTLMRTVTSIQAPAGRPRRDRGSHETAARRGADATQRAPAARS
jgi:hypothetical protein